MEATSPIGRRRMVSNPEPKVYTVPEESFEVPEGAVPIMGPQNMEDAVPAAPQGSMFVPKKPEYTSSSGYQKIEKRISPLAKERLEFLLKLGRARREVEVEGIKFTLQSLKAQEQQEATIAGAKCETNTEALFVIRNNTLARALVAIDGETVEVVLGAKEKDALEVKLDLLGGMDEEVIEFLNREYNEMLKENRERLFPKPVEVKEAVEEIKK